MIAYCLWFILLLSLAGAGAMHSTIVDLKITKNYRGIVQELYHNEGVANVVAHYLWEDRDMDGNSQGDKMQVHGGGIVSYVLDGYNVSIIRHPSNPNQAIVQVGRIELEVQNFPGGGVSCSANGKCEPRIFAWREL